MLPLYFSLTALLVLDYSQCLLRVGLPVGKSFEDGQTSCLCYSPVCAQSLAGCLTHKSILLKFAFVDGLRNL